MRVPRALGVRAHPDGVVHRDVLDVEHGQRDAGVHHLEDAVDHVRRRDAAEHGVGSGGSNCFAHRVEHRHAGDAGAALARRDAADERACRAATIFSANSRPVVPVMPCMRMLRIGTDQDRHRAIPALRDIASTTASTRAVASLRDGV